MTEPQSFVLYNFVGAAAWVTLCGPAWRTTAICRSSRTTFSSSGRHRAHRRISSVVVVEFFSHRRRSATSVMRPAVALGQYHLAHANRPGAISCRWRRRRVTSATRATHTDARREPAPRAPRRVHASVFIVDLLAATLRSDAVPACTWTARHRRLPTVAQAAEQLVHGQRAARNSSARDRRASWSE